MSERDFEFGTFKFKLNKINALKQFHIARKMGPILSQLLPLMGTIGKQVRGKELDNLSEAEKFDRFIPVAKPIMDGLSSLSDEDANQVLLGLLSAVEIQQNTGNWARVADGGHLMFDNLELPVLLAAAARAFVYNLQGFFSALPQK